MATKKKAAVGEIEVIRKPVPVEPEPALDPPTEAVDANVEFVMFISKDEWQREFSVMGIRARRRAKDRRLVYAVPVEDVERFMLHQLTKRRLVREGAAL